MSVSPLRRVGGEHPSADPEVDTVLSAALQPPPPQLQEADQLAQTQIYARKQAQSQIESQPSALQGQQSHLTNELVSDSRDAVAAAGPSDDADAADLSAALATKLTLHTATSK